MIDGLPGALGVVARRASLRGPWRDRASWSKELTHDAYGRRYPESIRVRLDPQEGAIIVVTGVNAEKFVAWTWAWDAYVIDITVIHNDCPVHVRGYTRDVMRDIRVIRRPEAL